MKITKVSIPKEYGDSGIDSIKMERLGRVVLITGKNGSGKTRLLNKLRAALSEKPNKPTLDYSQDRIRHLYEVIAEAEARLDSLSREQEGNNEPVRITFEMQGLTTVIESNRNQIPVYQPVLDWNLLETDKIEGGYTFIDFVPKQLDLRDSNSMSRDDLISAAQSVSKIGIGNLPAGTLAKIQNVHERWFSATHPDSRATDEERQSAKEDYQRLNESISAFLNTTLSWDLDNNATLFGKPLGKTNLSDGQKVLLQFCVAIYSQRTSFRDLIFMLDEPENHLHPSVIIETIEQISKCVENGQIWIATHSIPLLAHFDPKSIWYMENGEISFAGNIPEKVLESLLGSEEEIAKLHDFIGLPAQLALNHFAFECLLEPGVAVNQQDDPQLRQIRSQLGIFEVGQPAKVLDYGAGKCRLLANIVESFEATPEKLPETIDYIAFDKFSDNRGECEALLETAYSSSKDRYFNDHNVLLSKHDRGSFDFVVMSNVLHEIDPKNWFDLFREGGEITSLLKENGKLILVEDTQVPVGEMAYQNGFIVLDTPQLKELFQMGQKEFVFEDERNGRLKCHVIPRDCLIRISAESRVAALDSLCTLAMAKIHEVRNADKNYKNGKLHGYWIQQLANTTLALSELRN